MQGGSLARRSDQTFPPNSYLTMEAMDLSTGVSPTPIRSFDLNAEPSNSNNNGKKRKLQYENLILPSPKCKFRDRFRDSDDDDTSIEVIGDEDEDEDDASEISNGGSSRSKKDDRSDCSVGSFRGSNRFDGPHESDMTVDTSSRVTASALEYTSHCNQPSTSSGSCSNIFRVPNNLPIQDMFEHEDDDDDSQDELMQYKEQFYEFEAFSDLLSSEIESSVLNKCISADAGGLLGYPKGLTSDSTARSIDTKPAVKKPTIDQEFEEYFSSLML